MSKGEKYVASCLRKLKIAFEREKKFPDCKHKTYLRFDFYLPDHNILIEYDGEHHYKPILQWHEGRYSVSKERAQEHLNDVKMRDKIKNKYCKERDITLIRINYNNREQLNQMLIELEVG